MQTSTVNQNQNDVPVITPTRPQRRHVGRWLTLAVLLILVGATSLFLLNKDDDQGAVRAASVSTVEIVGGGFQPQTIKVKKGSSVMWVNSDNHSHHIVADPYPTGDSLKSLNSGEPITEGESYTTSFDDAGTFHYHDQTDPTGFKGTVIVE